MVGFQRGALWPEAHACSAAGVGSNAPHLPGSTTDKGETKTMTERKDAHAALKEIVEKALFILKTARKSANDRPPQ